MPGPDSLYPFEFAVRGTPRSLQAKDKTNKAAWMKRVADAALDRRNEVAPMAFLDERPLSATLFYFPALPMAGDIDNIVKPIVDALKGILYPDDRLIERVVVQKFEPDNFRIFESPGEQLAAVLDMTPPVVYVRVVDDLGWRSVR